MSENDTGWQRLSWLMLLVNLKWLVPPAASVAIYALFTGGQLNKEAFTRLSVVTGIFLLVLLGETVSVLTTQYRVTDELFEIRKGLLSRQHKSIPRDRIRRVDLTAGPLQRIFGLSMVSIGTGQSHGENSKGIKLHALSKQDAHELRQLLFHQSEVTDTGTLLRLNWSWIRYSPLTIWGVIGIAILAAAAWRGLEIFGIKQNDTFNFAVHLLTGVELWKVILIVAGALVLLGVLGCLVTFAEEWWNYRLERDDTAIRIQRGLLTTRALSVDRQRVRGVEVAEPLLMRLGGAGRVDVVATGMKTTDKEDHKELEVLTPAIPRAQAHQVAGNIVGEQASPTESQLHQHPKAALRRRCIRAILGVVLPLSVLALAGALWLPELLTAAWISAIVLLPVALMLAVDAYRALGHGLTSHFLLTRYGTFDRRTVALQRNGVIGWKIVRSPTQRLSGLATVDAITAAGKHGSYKIRDVKVADGLRVAEAAVPGLLTPFLRHRDNEVVSPESDVLR